MLFIKIIYKVWAPRVESWDERRKGMTNGREVDSSRIGRVVVLFRHGEFGLLEVLMRTNITQTSMELFLGPQKNFLRHKYPARTFLFYRFNQSVPYTRHLESAWRFRTFFWLWNSSMEVLVILVRMMIFNSPNSSCLNY